MGAPVARLLRGRGESACAGSRCLASLKAQRFFLFGVEEKKQKNENTHTTKRVGQFTLQTKTEAMADGSPLSVHLRGVDADLVR